MTIFKSPNPQNRPTTTNLAEYIDQDNKPSFTPISEDPLRINNKRAQEGLLRVEPGRLFHGYITDYEVRTSAKGTPYLRFNCELECNQWKMSHTKFFPWGIKTDDERNIITNTILQELGYDAEQQTFPGIRLFKIGSWQDKEGGEHVNIESIYRDEHAYNVAQQLAQIV